MSEDELKSEAGGAAETVASGAPGWQAATRNLLCQEEPRLEVRCFHALEQVAPWRRALAALNLVSRQQDPFSTLEYLETYARNDEQYAPGDRPVPWFLIGFRRSAPVAYLPLRLVGARVLGFPTPTLEFMVSHDCDRPHVVAAPEHEAAATAAFLAYVWARRAEWTVLRLPQQDATSTFRPLPPAFRHGGDLLREVPGKENFTVPLGWGDGAAYFRALSRNQRNGIAKNIRKLLAAGAVEHLSSEDPGCTPALLELYASIEPRSWKARVSGTITRHARRLGHFRELLSPAQPMRLRIDLLTLDQAPIAGLITGRYGRRLYGLQMVYDTTHRALGPGSLLLLLSVTDATANRLQCFNLLSGSGHYKRRWLADGQPTVEVQAIRRFSAAWAKAVFGEVKHGLILPAPEPARFNPQRRAVELQGPPGPPPTELERGHWRALLRRVRGQSTRVLDHAAIAALLPFSLG